MAKRTPNAPFVEDLAGSVLAESEVDSERFEIADLLLGRIPSSRASAALPS